MLTDSEPAFTVSEALSLYRVGCRKSLERVSIVKERQFSEFLRYYELVQSPLFFTKACVFAGNHDKLTV